MDDKSVKVVWFFSTSCGYDDELQLLNRSRSIAGQITEYLVFRAWDINFWLKFIR